MSLKNPKVYYSRISIIMSRNTNGILSVYIIISHIYSTISLDYIDVDYIDIDYDWIFMHILGKTRRTNG